MKFNGHKTVKEEATASPVAATPSVAVATPTPAPTVKRETINVKVLNGSGAKGKASELKTLLKDKGYVDILTGNADNFDFTTTEIQVKADNKSLGEVVKEDIKSVIPSPKVTTLEASSAADVVIIFGTDFK